MQKVIFATALCGLMLITGFAGWAKSGWAKNAKGSQPTLQDVAFLHGHWQCQTKRGSDVEEYWSAPQGDSMIGHCRIIKKGTTTFFELMAIVSKPNGLVLCMRHFNGGMIPWEEKDESGDCSLVSFSKNEVAFASGGGGHSFKVTYTRTGDETLFALAEEVREGKTYTYPFSYKLVQ